MSDYVKGVSQLKDGFVSIDGHMRGESTETDLCDYIQENGHCRGVECKNCMFHHLAEQPKLNKTLTNIPLVTSQ